jgi:hypothetical protein
MYLVLFRIDGKCYIYIYSNRSYLLFYWRGYGETVHGGVDKGIFILSEFIIATRCRLVTLVPQSLYYVLSIKTRSIASDINLV